MDLAFGCLQVTGQEQAAGLGFRKQPARQTIPAESPKKGYGTAWNS